MHSSTACVVEIQDSRFIYLVNKSWILNLYYTSFGTQSWSRPAMDVARDTYYTHLCNINLKNIIWIQWTPPPPFGLCNIWFKSGHSSGVSWPLMWKKKLWQFCADQTASFFSVWSGLLMSEKMMVKYSCYTKYSLSWPEAFFKYWPVWFDVTYLFTKKASQSHVIRLIGWFNIVYQAASSRVTETVSCRECFQKCFSIVHKILSVYG